MRGASALQEVLTKDKNPLSVYVVWEPVLPTDWKSPGTGTLGRLFDRRVRQFWDKEHLISAEMRKAAESYPSEIPVQRRRTNDKADGILWDAIAIFKPGAKWDTTMPVPKFLGGTVVKVIGDVEGQLSAAPRRNN